MTGTKREYTDAMAATDMPETVPDPMLTAQVTRGVCRLWGGRGYGTLTEFRIRTGRRIDVMALGSDGEFVAVEVKVSTGDFRQDSKWREYLDFCDRFYFAVPERFPRDMLPADCGLIVADAYEAAILREAPVVPLNGTRKRNQLLRFAQAASKRLHRIADPDF